MNVFVYLNDSNFDNGIFYVKNLRSSFKKTIILSNGLKSSRRSELSEFEVRENVGIYDELCSNSESSVLVTSFSKKLPIFTDLEKIYCSGFSNLTSEIICSPIDNIFERVKISNLMEEKILKKWGKFLSIEYIAAPNFFWQKMNLIFKKWSTEHYYSANPIVHDLLFNFCVSFFQNSIIVENNHGLCN